MQRIDAHQHFWQVSRGDYGWLTPELGAIHRDFLPADFADIRKKHAISQSILVQAAPTEVETEFMLTLAQQDPAIGGVVGWVDMADPQSAATIERWAKYKAFKGIRPMLQDLPDADWLATQPHPDVVKALIAHGLSFDALVKPQHLKALVKFAQKYPELPIVIDHCAKPALGQGWQGDWPGQWLRGLMALGTMPQVSIKLSGLLTEMTPEQLHDPAPFLAPVCEFIGEVFGPDRILWGSDWPVVTLAASYDRWCEISGHFIDPLEPEHRHAILHSNAARFYRLEG